MYLKFSPTAQNALLVSILAWYHFRSSWAVATSLAIGFSDRTCLPASSAFLMNSGWTRIGRLEPCQLDGTFSRAERRSWARDARNDHCANIRARQHIVVRPARTRVIRVEVNIRRATSKCLGRLERSGVDRLELQIQGSMNGGLHWALVLGMAEESNGDHVPDAALLQRDLNGVLIVMWRQSTVYSPLPIRATPTDISETLYKQR